MKKLTAYNNDVQKYLQLNKLNTQKKNEIIDTIRRRVNDKNQSFESLFPTRSKRKDVMDYIIYLLSGNGICKISAETLASKATCSIRTVNSAVRALKQTGEIIVAGLADGKNKYVFVLKMHPNFPVIMKEVFYVDAEQIAGLTAEQVAEQKIPKTVETVRLEDEKKSSNYTNSINSSNSLKQEIKDIEIRKENIIQSFKDDNNFIDYRIPQSMRMELATAFDSNVLNESFHNALNIAKKAAKECNLLADKDIFNSILTNASVALYTKTQEFEHNGTLMKNPIGYFTRTFKKMVYTYIDSIRNIHNIAQRKTNVQHASNFAVFKQIIGG